MPIIAQCVSWHINCIEISKHINLFYRFIMYFLTGLFIGIIVGYLIVSAIISFVFKRNK